MAELFNITHDANNLNEYDVTVVDGGDLSTGLPGLASTTAKMEAFIDDATAIYGQVNEAAPVSNQIRWRFYLDPNTITMGEGDNFEIGRVALSQAPWIECSVFLGYVVATGYRIAYQVYDDSGNHWNGWYNITDAEHYIEIHTVRETFDGGADGNCQLWIDGISQRNEQNLDNWTVFSVIDKFRLGAIASIDSPSTSGTFYLDELKANDDGGVIGPVVAGGAASRAMYDYRRRRV